jgi:hypothetical protein
MMRAAMVFLAASVIAPAGAALAQSFPADSAWRPFRCGADPMTDAADDHPGAVQERDVVGTAQAPAGLRASDPDFLYLRLRVSSDPRQGPNLRPAAWGFAFSTDDVSTSYEVLVTLDGASRVVSLFRHTITRLADDPGDPADAPPLATYPYATHARVVDAQTMLGRDRNHFIDIAVPWPALRTAGLAPETLAVVWAASSSNADRLNGDFACHDGASGAVRLSSSGSVAERSESGSDPAGGAVGGAGGGAAGSSGGAGSGAGGLSVEGGPGCRYAGRGARGWALSMLAALAACLALRRRRRR